MKANYGVVNKAKLRKETLTVVDRIVRERENEIIDAVKTSVMTQTLSVAFWILHREYGFGAKRLQRLKNQIEDEFVLMAKKPLGKEYTPLDIRAALKEQYGVDFSETQYKGGID